MSWFKENKKIVAAGAGLLVALGLGYLLIKEDKAEQVNQQQQEQGQTQSEGQQQQTVQKTQTNSNSISNDFQGFGRHRPTFADNQSYNRKITETVKQIQEVPGWNNQIDIQTLSLILEFSVDVYSEFYTELTKQQRKLRRSLSGEAYLECIKDQVNVVEQDLNYVQEHLVSQLGFTPQEFEQAVQTIAMMGYQQQLIMLDMATKQMLKTKVPSTQGKDQSKAKDILRFQLEIIQTQSKEFLDKIMQILTPEEFPRVSYYTNFLLVDKIYEKYQIEEEDVNHMIPSREDIDQEIMQLMQQFEQAMQGLMMQLQQSMPMPQQMMM